MKAHQKHPVGYETIDEYLERDFRKPKNFEMYWLMFPSLFRQKDRIAIEAHRRAKPYCMGTMYWQLNDCWPVVSWSARDYYGKPKALYYRLKNAFSDQFISPEIKNDTVRIYATTDDGVDQNIVFRMFLYDFGGNILWQYDSVVRLDSRKSILLAEASRDYLLQGYDPKGVFLYMELRNILGARGSKVMYFLPPKDLALQKPSYSVQVSDSDAGYNVELSANTQCLYVRLSTDIPGEFSENYFDLQAGTTKALLFRTMVKDPDFAKKLKVISLYDSYN